MLSRDALTRAMAGDALGGIQSRSAAIGFERFRVGDPFLAGLLPLVGRVAKGAGHLVRKLGHSKAAQAHAMGFLSPGVGPGAEIGANVSPQVTSSIIRRAGGLPSRQFIPRRGGFLSATARLIPGGMRRRHHMRVTNPKALRRAMRRVQGFAKLAHRTIAFTKRVHMRKHRRR